MRCLLAFVVHFAFIGKADQQLLDEWPPLSKQFSTPLDGKHLRLLTLQVKFSIINYFLADLLLCIPYMVLFCETF